LRNIEIVEMFELQENVLGLRGMPLLEAPRFDELTVEGVRLSIRPDFFIQPPNGRVGAGIIRVAKAPDPADCKQDATRRRKQDHRREMARYVIAMFQMLLEAQKGKYGVPDHALSFVADVRLGERINAGPDHSARVRAIRAACRQIDKLWPTIKPRSSLFKKD
jgi:hypothetical protein